MKYPKLYTVKEWKRFDHIAERENGCDITAQEILLQKYDVILTDCKIKHSLIEKDYYFDINGVEKSDQLSHVKEKLFGIIDKFNAKNLNSGIDKFNKGVNQFSKVVASTQGNNKPRTMGISQKDYDKLFKSPKSKGNTTNFWNEDKKTRKKRNRPVKEYSFLTKQKKVKFF